MGILGSMRAGPGRIEPHKEATEDGGKYEQVHDARASSIMRGPNVCVVVTKIRAGLDSVAMLILGLGPNT